MEEEIQQLKDALNNQNDPNDDNMQSSIQNGSKHIGSESMIHHTPKGRHAVKPKHSLESMMNIAIDD